MAWHRVPFTLGCAGNWSEKARAEHYDDLCQIDGRIALDALSIEKRGQLLFILVNARPMAELQIDQRVADGRIYVASGLTKADIESFKKCWRLIGEKKKR